MSLSLPRKAKTVTLHLHPQVNTIFMPYCGHIRPTSDEHNRHRGCILVSQALIGAATSLFE